MVNNIYYMKYINLFENYNKKEEIFNTIYSAKPGDVIDSDIIYTYVQYLHDISEFIDGNLGERIEHYPQYELVEIDISKIDTEEYTIYEDKVDDFIEMYKQTNKYPPIVIDHQYSIIDGTHRANALEQLGHSKILALIGINNDEIFDPFN